MSPDICIPEDELRAFLLGEVYAEVAATISAHLETCPKCQLAADRLDKEGDRLIHSLRAALAVPAPSPAPPSPTGNLAAATTLPDTAASAPFRRHVAGYKILGELGRGGMSIVYKARQPGPERLVALKMILRGSDARPEERARFLAEADAIAQLQHPNIVQIYEVGEQDSLPFFSLELVSGGNLAEKWAGVPQPSRQAAELVETLAKAVHHAHQRGVIHRDLKPANILLTEQGQPKISDFGLAKQQRHELTATRVVLGSPSYMAPEQAAGDNRAVGPTTDVYALGAILYECLTGRPPFLAQTLLETLEQVRHSEPVPPQQLNAQVPRDLETICLKCLQKEPRRRYPSAEALAEDLNNWRTGRPINARPVGRLERAVKWVKRQPALAGLLAGLVLAVVTVAGSIGWVALDQAARQAAQAAREAALDEEMNRSVADAELLMNDSKWPQARTLVERAENTEKLMRAAGRTNFPPRLLELKGDLDMAERLQEIYSHPRATDYYRGKGSDDEYAQAFSAYGIDINALTVSEAAERIRGRSIRLELVRGLDFWTLMRRRRDGQYLPLMAVAQAADSDPWRRRLRMAVVLGYSLGYRKTVEDLVATADIANLPPSSLYLLGRIVEESLANPDRAVQLFLKAQRRYPKDVWLNDWLAWHYLNAQPPQYENALRFFSVLQALRPDNPHMAWYKGKALAAKGSLAEAIDEYSHALVLQPDHWNALFDRGCAYRQVGKEDNARADFSRLINLAPRSPSDWRIRGLGHESLGDWEKAIADFSEAIELDRDFFLARFDRARGHLQRNQADKAVADLSVAIRLNPQFVPAWTRRGEAHLALGQYEKVAADFGKVLKLSPQDPYAWTRRGEAHLALGQYEKAAADFGKREELLHHVAADEYVQVFKGAADSGKRLELLSRDPYVWFENACLLLQAQGQRGYSKLCQRMFERFNRSENGWEISCLAHACVLAPDALIDETQVIQLAQRRLAIAWTKSPSGHDFLSTFIMGLAYYRVGRYTEAIELLEKNEKTSPQWDQNVFNWLALAMAHHQLKHLGEAQQWLAKASQWIEQNTPHKQGKTVGSVAQFWQWGWWVKLTMRRLEHEAKGLLQTHRLGN